MLESQSINTFKTRLDKALVDVYLRTIQLYRGTGLEGFKKVLLASGDISNYYEE